MLSNYKSLVFCICLVFILAGSANSQTCDMDSSFAPSNIDVPTKIVAGKSVRVRVNVFNSGTCMWQPRKVQLSIKVIRKPSGSPYPLEEFKSALPLRISVNSKKGHTWYYEITGPYHLGTYTLEWTMTSGGKPFGVQVRKTIEVVAPR